MIYLDNSSTTRQADEVTESMLRAMREDFGNPSSLHQLGLDAENMVTEARKEIAAAFGASPEEIVFNSGGTEGDNTVLQGAAYAGRRTGNRIITTKVEHPAVLESCERLAREGFEIVYLNVDDRCMPDLNELRDAINEETLLVSMMAVNNEVGTILPIREAAEIAHEHKVWFHTDAVQALGKIPLQHTGADMITVSGHKIHGPKGIGAVYVRKGVRVLPLIVGGGQEKAQRSGTENVPGIVGLGRAAALMQEELAECTRMREAYQKDPGAKLTGMTAVRQYLLAGLKDQIKDIRVNSPESPAESAASVLNISFLGTRGEVILHTLEADGIYVSTGSACSAHKKGRSHVLTAMGLSDREIEGAVRFSLSRYNTIEEMDVVIDRTAQAVRRFRRLGSFR
ncbi:MAG: cysteine desulfurase [Eubacterium sp.]|nr:cysteine desulfurase [Eubacterium sp.]